MKLKMIGTMMVLMMAFLFCSNQASATSTKETAKEISFNTGVTGELSNYNDVDWYKFTIPASIGNVSINVNLAAYSGNPHAEVYDESLNLLGWADSQTSFGGRIQGSECWKTTMTYYEPGKTYYIQVCNSKSKYTVAVSTIKDDNWGSLDKAENLSINTRYNRNLEALFDIDAYKVAFPNDGKKYALCFNSARGSSLNVKLLNGLGVPITEITVEEGNNRIFDCLAGQSYYVVINGYRICNYSLMAYRVENTGKSTNTTTNPYKIVVPKLSISKKNKKAVLKWNKKNGYKGCKIYRSTKKNGKYKCVKSISKKTSYTDKKVKKGKTYYYKVKIFTKQGTKIYYSRYSKVKKIKIK